MLRILALGFLLAAAPAAAAHFRAEPVAKPASAKLVLRDTMWLCDGASCSAARSNSRPQIVCALLAREVGALKSFTVAGTPLPADQLEKCNARAQ